MRIRFFSAVALLVAVFAAIMWHLWGIGFFSEFHADFTDTLLWAEASVESGQLASPDFHYAYFIPFGGNLLMNVFIPFFGVGVTTIRCGMTVMILIMCAVLISFFRSLGKNAGQSVVMAAFVLCLLCSSIKLREVFFVHVIHYSLGACFLMAACAVVCSTVQVRVKSPIARQLLFGVLLAWVASCGPAMLLYVVMPVLGGFVIWRVFDLDPFVVTARRDISWLCIGIVGVLVGLALYSWLASGVPPTYYEGAAEYTDFYEQLCAPKYWIPNLNKLPMQWLTLFLDMPPPHTKIATPMGMRIVMRVVCGLALAIGPALAWFRYRLLDDRAKFILIVHWVLAGGILFYWVFGNISNYNWRLSPLIFTSSAVVMCLICDLWRDGRVLLRRFAGGGMIAMSAIAVYLPVAMVRLPDRTDVLYGEDALLPLLEKIGAPYGYCDDFWFSNSITVLTNGRIKLRQVRPCRSGGWEPHKYQSADHWYAPCPQRDKTVFVCRKSVAMWAPKENLIARYTCRQYNFWLQHSYGVHKIEDFVVFVYDGDFPQKLLR